MNVPVATGPRFASAHTLTRDTTCRRCGYNLRGLSEEGNCPECGAAVSLSTRGDWLACSGPDWIESIAFGAQCLFLGIAFLPVSIPLAGYTNGLSLLIIAALVLVGAWFITIKDPSDTSQIQHPHAGRIVRALAIVCAAQIVFAALHYDDFRKLQTYGRVLIPTDIIVLGLGLAQLLNVLIGLIQRMRDPKLWDDADRLKRRIVFGFPVILVLYGLIWVPILLLAALPLVFFVWCWAIWFWITFTWFTSSLSRQLHDHISLAHDLAMESRSSG